jgi:hypothetical protein
MRSEMREKASLWATDVRFRSDVVVAHGISPARFAIAAVGVIARFIAFLPVSMVFQRPASPYFQCSPCRI